MENAYVNGDYSFGDDTLHGDIDRLESVLRETIDQLAYSSNGRHVRCRVCQRLEFFGREARCASPVSAKQNLTHRDGCIVAEGEKLVGGDV